MTGAANIAYLPLEALSVFDEEVTPSGQDTDRRKVTERIVQRTD